MYYDLDLSLINLTYLLSYLCSVWKRPVKKRSVRKRLVRKHSFRKRSVKKTFSKKTFSKETLSKCFQLKRLGKKLLFFLSLSCICVLDRVCVLSWNWEVEIKNYIERLILREKKVFCQTESFT